MDRARSGEKRVGGWAGAGINGLADKIISEAMLKKGSLAAPRAILSLSLLSGREEQNNTCEGCSLSEEID